MILEEMLPKSKQTDDFERWAGYHATSLKRSGRHTCPLNFASTDRSHGLNGLGNLGSFCQNWKSIGLYSRQPCLSKNFVDPATDLARCFLRLANLSSYPLDRLSRYEAILWRQAGQIPFALDALDRRKPQERWRRFRRNRVMGGAAPPFTKMQDSHALKCANAEQSRNPRMAPFVIGSNHQSTRNSRGCAVLLAIERDKR